MKNKPTIKEFADLLGVSTATVSRAFSDKGRISEKTRRRIISRARELGYCANIHARSLGGNRSNSIALFYPALGNEEPDYFITEIMLGINNALQKTGHQLQINPFPLESPEKTLEAYRGQLLEGGFAGVIIVAGDAGSKLLLETAQNYGIPYVVIGHMSGLDCNAVLFDNEYGAHLAGKYFRNIGRKYPAYIDGHLGRRKRSGFQRGLGMAEAGIAFSAGGNSFRHGGLAFENLKATHPEVDCVLCANDVLAIGFIRAALNRGVKIPDDIAVIGFDDIRPARYFTPALSSVSLHMFEIGANAVGMLMRLFGGEEQISSETLECDLVLRESS